jgi:hypothetical protein
MTGLDVKFILGGVGHGIGKGAAVRLHGPKVDTFLLETPGQAGEARLK